MMVIRRTTIIHCTPYTVLIARVYCMTYSVVIYVVICVYIGWYAGWYSGTRSDMCIRTHGCVHCMPYVGPCSDMHIHTHGHVLPVARGVV